METRVNNYYFGTLRPVAGSDDLGSEIFCKIPVGNIVGRWNNGRRGTANNTPKTEWWDVKLGKAVRCTPPVRCSPYYLLKSKGIPLFVSDKRREMGLPMC